MKISEIWGGNVLSLQKVLFGYEDQPGKKFITSKSQYRDHLLCGVQEQKNLAALICVKSNKILYQQLSLSDDDQMNY